MKSCPRKAAGKCQATDKSTERSRRMPTAALENYQAKLDKSSNKVAGKPLIEKGYPANWTEGTRWYKETDVVAAVKRIKGRMCCGHNYDKTCTCWTCKDIDFVFGKVD